MVKYNVASPEYFIDSVMWFDEKFVSGDFFLTKNLSDFKTKYDGRFWNFSVFNRHCWPWSVLTYTFQQLLLLIHLHFTNQFLQILFLVVHFGFWSWPGQLNLNKLAQMSNSGLLIGVEAKHAICRLYIILVSSLLR